LGKAAMDITVILNPIKLKDPISLASVYITNPNTIKISNQNTLAEIRLK
jgi:hypothetical protein